MNGAPAGPYLIAHTRLFPDGQLMPFLQQPPATAVCPLLALANALLLLGPPGGMALARSTAALSHAELLALFGERKLPPHRCCVDYFSAFFLSFSS